MKKCAVCGADQKDNELGCTNDKCVNRNSNWPKFQSPFIDLYKLKKQDLDVRVGKKWKKKRS